MGWLYLIGLVAAVCLLVWVIGRISQIGAAPAAKGASGVRGVLPICTDGELVFLAVLERAVPEGTRVLCKVRVADVIDTFGTDFRTVSSKHFDFVVCDEETLLPLLAVELDDKSHLTATAQRSDAVKNDVCYRAGLRILRVRAQAGYDVQDLAQRVAAELAEYQTG